MKARFGIWAHLFLLFVLAKMIIHHGNTLLCKYSWKEITKKYREGIWLSFCSQGNCIQDGKQCHELTAKEHLALYRGHQRGARCQGMPASSGHECHQQLRGGKGPKSLRIQRHQQWLQPAWHFHGNSPVDLFEHKPEAQGFQEVGALLRTHFRRLIFTQNLGKLRQFSQFVSFSPLLFVSFFLFFFLSCLISHNSDSQRHQTLSFPGPSISPQHSSAATWGWLL